jgi:hypothetical protein
MVGDTESREVDDKLSLEGPQQPTSGPWRSPRESREGEQRSRSRALSKSFPHPWFHSGIISSDSAGMDAAWERAPLQVQYVLLKGLAILCSIVVPIACASYPHIKLLLYIYMYVVCMFFFVLHTISFKKMFRSKPHVSIKYVKIK